MLRDWLKSAEFHLPPALAGPFHALAGGRYTCYGPENDALRAIFVHVPKVAGSSVSNALFGVRPRHVPLVRYLANDADRFRRYFKFAFVRDPWDRTHSAYHYLRRGVGRLDLADGRWATRHLAAHDTFASFVAALESPSFRRVVLGWLHFRPQAHWLRIPGRRGIACDFVGRFERLDADFAHVCAVLGVERTLPQLRRSGGGSFRDAYDARMADVVARVYAEDIDAFGYRFASAPETEASPAHG